MRRQTKNQFVDLVISEAKPSAIKKVSRNYRICTLTRSKGQQTINLRVPESVQDRILDAYKSGKTVRIFA